MEVLEKYLGVMVPSMLKFLLGPLAGVALKLSWWETLFCTIAGMMISVLVVVFLGKAIRKGWQHFRKTPPKRFTKNSRRAVRVYRKFGIAGIACLTPLIFTPIGGTLIATSFNVAPIRILFWMAVFALLWGIVLTLAIYHIPGLQHLL